MPEIKRSPVRISIDPIEGDAVEYDAFDEGHSLADIARWLLTNKVDAREVLGLLEEGLND